MSAVLFALIGIFAAGSPLAAHGLPADTAAVVASAPPDPWRASLFYTYASLSGDRLAWQTVQVYLTRHFARGALTLEAMQVRRFDRADEAAALDSYLDLWRGAYGNLRLQVAPEARILPEADLYAELFQAVGGGWELSGSYRMRRYPEETFHFAGLGIGRYVGDWYVRSRSTLFPFADRIGFAQAFFARRYWEPPQAFFELGAGAGRGLEVIEAGPVVEVTHTYFVAVRVQRYLTEHLGLSALASYSDDEFFRRRTLMLGLLARW